MPFDLSLSLAGLPFRVRLPDEERDNALARYGAFESAPDVHATFVDCTLAPHEALEQPPEVVHPGGRVTVDGDRVTFLRWGERLVYEPARRHASLVVNRLTPAPQPPCAESALRVLLSMRLVAENGLLLHAAGGTDGSQALVFPAFSGGGKTTTARKLEHSRVLSDDQVAVRRVEGTWRAYSLPFIGLYGKPTLQQDRTLAAIAFLEKAPAPQLTALSPAKAAARLLGCVVQFLPRTPAKIAMDRAAQLATEVPAFRLALTVEEPIGPWMKAIAEARAH